MNNVDFLIQASLFSDNCTEPTGERKNFAMNWDLYRNIVKQSLVFRFPFFSEVVNFADVNFSG